MLKSVPALSIFIPYSLASKPIIFSNSLKASTSCSVHVGDFNNNVSEIIALIINVAILESISTPFALYSSNSNVFVQP